MSDPPPPYERPTDDEILEYERQLREEQDGNMPIIGHQEPIVKILQLYENSDDVFIKKAHSLVDKHDSFRTVKKDGNCFYLAVGFQILEQLHVYGRNPWGQQLMVRIASTKEMLKDCSEDILSEFYEPFQEIFTLVSSMSESDVPNAIFNFEQRFNSSYGTSQNIMFYLRMITSAELKKHAELYTPFLPDGYTRMEDFTAKEVDVVNAEADQIQITALANVLGIKFKIANLDHAGSDLNYHEIEPGMSSPAISVSGPTIGLLYRPGHYEILY